jgi:hypothetical protein
LLRKRLQAGHVSHLGQRDWFALGHHRSALMKRRDSDHDQAYANPQSL